MSLAVVRDPRTVIDLTVDDVTPRTVIDLTIDSEDESQ
jgi:hypothetical protein